MKFEWEKLGLILDPKKHLGNGWSHAQVPFTRKIEGELRIYFSTRKQIDGEGQYVSVPRYVDFRFEDFPQKFTVGETPIIQVGNDGDFDRFGAMAGSVVRIGDHLSLFYTGWNRSVSVPYDWNIGVAEGNLAGSAFSRVLPGPIIGPSPGEPYLFACPVVFNFGGALRMLYLGGEKWFKSTTGKMESQYLLRTATSVDGLHWDRSGSPLLSAVVADESQTSATVIQIEQTYYMFFSYRYGVGFREEPGKGYRIGVAVSHDFETWDRQDQLAGIDVSSEGWDSEMVAYPHLFSLNGDVYMLYCGNSFGSGGFGLARLRTSLAGKKWRIITSDGD